MKIRIYLQFPEDDDDLLTINNQTNGLVRLIKELLNIKRFIKDNETKFDLVYDSDNVNNFLSRASIISGAQYLDKIETQIKHLINTNSINLKERNFVQNRCFYFLWLMSNNVPQANLICQDAAEFTHRFCDQNLVIVAIDHNSNSWRDTFQIIKDGFRKSGLPIIIPIPIIRSAQDFNSWYSFKFKNKFSLRNTTLFHTTNFKWHNQKIYEEINTEYYWYFDYFHRKSNPHYEVFDKNGDHLGEADEFGNLDKSKMDPNKSIRNIIN